MTKHFASLRKAFSWSWKKKLFMIDSFSSSTAGILIIDFFTDKLLTCFLEQVRYLRLAIIRHQPPRRLKICESVVRVNIQRESSAQLSPACCKNMNIKSNSLRLLEKHRSTSVRVAWIDNNDPPREKHCLFSFHVSFYRYTQMNTVQLNE